MVEIINDLLRLQLQDQADQLQLDQEHDLQVLQLARCDKTCYTSGDANESINATCR